MRINAKAVYFYIRIVNSQAMPNKNAPLARVPFPILVLLQASSLCLEGRGVVGAPRVVSTYYERLPVLVRTLARISCFCKSIIKDTERQQQYATFLLNSQYNSLPL